MDIKKLSMIFFTIVLLSSSILPISVLSDSSQPSIWNKEWSNYQEIFLPIPTEESFAIYQPIDTQINFDHSCWAKNEQEHSIRIVCWDGNIWHELESQIYDLEFTDSNHIDKCNLVFLVPEIADGKERYFVYYDNSEKPMPNYIDHVNIEDSYYYYEPIPGISAELWYYSIIENDFLIYGIGQNGNVLNRRLSQAIIKNEQKTKSFDITNIGQIAVYSFSYQTGTKDGDYVSSDQELISKKITVDGNLMVEFGIVTESFGEEIRTTNIYKYYYCPTDTKRICVHSKHEVLKNVEVKGNINSDGNYGSLFTLKSSSERIPQMRFGGILPYLHVYGEDNNIKEYLMDLDPDRNENDWIISYTEDCDLGSDAWISSDEGENGKAFAILLSSNENIVKQGREERDGIQIKLVERQYLNIIGTQIDFASINFGRNSYEKGKNHDLDIPKDLVVEFYSEFFYSENGGYLDVQKEAEFFQPLAKHRLNGIDDSFKGDTNVYTLTVIPEFTGRLFSYPLLSNIKKINFPVTWVELYQNETCIASGPVYKTFLKSPKMTFVNIEKGDYIIKVYRKNGNFSKKFIGVKSVMIEQDETTHIYCTWEKNLKIDIVDQYKEHVKDVKILILKDDDTIICSNITDGENTLELGVPFNLYKPYHLKAFYKGFLISDKKIKSLEKKPVVNIDLYGLIVQVTDTLGMSPWVDVKPFLTSSEMTKQINLEPENMGSGTYLFKNLPSATYNLQISYADYTNSKTIHISGNDLTESVDFAASYDLDVEIYDLRGNLLRNGKKIEVIRNNKKVISSIQSDKTISLPPGKYTVNVYSDRDLVGSKIIELKNDKTAKIVTSIKTVIPTIVTGVIIVFIIQLLVLLAFKKISINTFLKLVAISLILVSVFQPWWVLHAVSNNPIAEKQSEMFVIPQTMIDTFTIEGETSFELATIPDVFTGFLGVLLLVVFAGVTLLGVSFIPNILMKRRFSRVLIYASILFLILVAFAFCFGMSQICKISLGSLQGEGMIDAIFPNGETVFMSTSWGLGIGFYICIFASLVAMVAGILDRLKHKEFLKELHFKK